MKYASLFDSYYKQLLTLIFLILSTLLLSPTLFALSPPMEKWNATEHVSSVFSAVRNGEPVKYVFSKKKVKGKVKKNDTVFSYEGGGKFRMSVGEKWKDYPFSELPYFVHKYLILPKKYTLELKKSSVSYVSSTNSYANKSPKERGLDYALVFPNNAAVVEDMTEEAKEKEGTVGEVTQDIFGNQKIPSEPNESFTVKINTKSGAVLLFNHESGSNKVIKFVLNSDGTIRKVNRISKTEYHKICSANLDDNELSGFYIRKEK